MNRSVGKALLRSPGGVLQWRHWASKGGSFTVRVSVESWGWPCVADARKWRVSTLLLVLELRVVACACRCRG